VKRAPDGLGPIVPLDRRLAKPLHRQLYDGYREAILDGRLLPGQRLPSTRAVANDLQVSRIPVVTAFEQLVAEGYVESRVGAGSFVSPALAERVKTAHATVAPRPGKRHLPSERLPIAVEPYGDLWGAFRAGQPALDELPDIWARLVARCSRLLPRRQLTYGDPMGFGPLRRVQAVGATARTTTSPR